jgi:hypothetical protein
MRPARSPRARAKVQLEPRSQAAWLRLPPKLCGGSGSESPVSSGGGGCRGTSPAQGRQDLSTSPARSRTGRKILQRGDTLMNLAMREYGNATCGASMSCAVPTQVSGRQPDHRGPEIFRSGPHARAQRWLRRLGAGPDHAGAGSAQEIQRVAGSRYQLPVDPSRFRSAMAATLRLPLRQVPTAAGHRSPNVAASRRTPADEAFVASVGRGRGFRRESQLTVHPRPSLI